MQGVGKEGEGSPPTKNGTQLSYPQDPNRGSWGRHAVEGLLPSLPPAAGDSCQLVGEEGVGLGRGATWLLKEHPIIPKRLPKHLYTPRVSLDTFLSGAFQAFRKSNALHFGKDQNASDQRPLAKHSRGGEALFKPSVVPYITRECQGEGRVTPVSALDLLTVLIYQAKYLHSFYVLVSWCFLTIQAKSICKISP